MTEAERLVVMARRYRGLCAYLIEENAQLKREHGDVRVQLDAALVLLDAAVSWDERARKEDQ